MENWKMYERQLTPLPLKVNGKQHNLRVLDEWERSEIDGMIIYEQSILLREKELQSNLILRMNRVGCRAKVFEDGVEIGRHYGGYTNWQVLLQKNQRKKRTLKICLEKEFNSISPFEKTDILCDIFLICLPKVYLQDFKISTLYKRNWRLEFNGCLVFLENEKHIRISVALEEIWDKRIISHNSQILTDENQKCGLILENLNIKPWSVQTPKLYNLRIQIWNGNDLLEEIVEKIGFRTIEVKGKQVLWNGEALKLRGLCYREPLKEDSIVLRKDLELFKEAGVNYLRSFYYPFGKEVLDICDELGILTEQSSSAYKVGRGIRPTQNLPDFQYMYAEQFSEILKESRNHVSTLLWCLGSECVWGNNFKICAEMAKELAPEQLLNFTYPMTIPKEDIQPDVWSVLYVDWRQPFDVMYDHMEIGHANGSENEIGYVTGMSRRGEKPVLHEVYAPLPCHNRQEIIRDDGIHEFWGESLVRFQEKMERTEGTLGGSILAAYDEDGRFSDLLEECKWGILNQNHEPKPEYYHLKMAFTNGRKLEKSLENHIKWNRHKEPRGSEYEVIQGQKYIICKNSVFKICISNQTGLICGVWRNGEKIIESGPYLQITKMVVGEWNGNIPYVEKTRCGVKLLLSGTYMELCDISYRIDITSDGKIETNYMITKLYRCHPPKVKAQIGLDPGGVDEFGVSYLLPDTMNRFSWNRKGIWEVYPAEHLGRNIGTVSIENKKDFESMKHYIKSAIIAGEKNCILIDGGGEISVRMKEENHQDCIIDDRNPSIVYKGTWYEMNDRAGNRNGTEMLSKTAGDYMEYEFEGTGVAVYGSVDHIGGLYRVTVDKNVICEYGSSFPKPIDVEAASRGYEKMYGMCMAEVHGLEYGIHTVCVEVLGETANGGNDTWVSVDYLEVENNRKAKKIRMIMNQDFNYTRLVRGNYVRPAVKIEEGKNYKTEMYLMDIQEG